jgi:hypothetical protein
VASSDDVDRSKRSFFEILFRPVRAAVKGYELPVDHSSANPPSKDRVIKGGANALVMAMLGPLARGELVAGYRLFQVQVGRERIDYVFDKAGAKVLVRLGGLGSSEGAAFGESATFRFVVDGTAPAGERDLVAARVLHEVKLRDRGQLWVVAEDGTGTAPSGAPAGGSPPAAGALGPSPAAPPTGGPTADKEPG